VQPGATSALAPSQQQIARAIGSGTQDHLKDLDDGDETALNAKKWKFASFFNRVKSQVREHWRPVDVYRRRDPTGSIYGNKDRYTLLRVQLKPDGSLANLTLTTPSGVEFLDDEAMEAFKQAQPFPNPPPQLVDGGSGMIDFSFGFYFEISGAPALQDLQVRPDVEAPLTPGHVTSTSTWLAAVVGVLADVFVTQIGAQHGRCFGSRPQVDLQLDRTFVRGVVDRRLEHAVGGRDAGVHLGVLEVGDQGGFAGGTEVEGAAVVEVVAAEAQAELREIQAGGVAGDLLAQGGGDAADVGVVAADGGLDQG
jgi:TonB family protein